MIDLHVHTTASDGQYTPTEVIEKAAAKGLKAIAITDHDTVDGLEEARAAAREKGMLFVNGTELSINFPHGEFHLLGLGFTEVSPSFKSLLDNMKQTRIERNLQIIKNMQEAGVDISYDEMKDSFPNTQLGRPHFAAMLVQKGVVRKRQDAFDRYLAKGRPWYVERVGINLDEAVVAIRESGGAPVIAHPMSLYLSWGKMPDIFQDFYERGVMGLEAFHPGARVTECLRLEELARKLGFFVTAGSDFHGEKIRADRKIGHTCGDKKIPDSHYDELMKALGREIHFTHEEAV